MKEYVGIVAEGKLKCYISLARLNDENALSFAGWAKPTALELALLVGRSFGALVRIYPHCAFSVYSRRRPDGRWIFLAEAVSLEYVVDKKKARIEGLPYWNRLVDLALVLEHEMAEGWRIELPF